MGENGDKCDKSYVGPRQDVNWTSECWNIVLIYRCPSFDTENPETPCYEKRWDRRIILDFRFRFSRQKIRLISVRYGGN